MSPPQGKQMLVTNSANYSIAVLQVSRFICTSPIANQSDCPSHMHAESSWEQGLFEVQPESPSCIRLHHTLQGDALNLPLSQNKPSAQLTFACRGCSRWTRPFPTFSSCTTLLMAKRYSGLRVRVRTSISPTVRLHKSVSAGQQNFSCAPAGGHGV